MILMIFIPFIVFLLVGVPVAISIALSSAFVLFMNDVPLVLTTQRMFAGTDTFPLVAVPFFILAGDLLAKGKVSEKLVNFADSLFGFMKGGLSIVAVLAGMFFAAISGSGAATTAAVGTTLVPELKKKGYDEASSAALIAASGTIGVIIPPSVPMILYAVIANVSVEKLFLSGFVPGILMGLFLIGIAIYQAKKRNYPTGARFELKNIWRTFKEAIWGLLTPIIILGGIFSGYFTPSEAAVVAVNYALIVSLFIYKDMKLKDVVDIITRSAMTMSVIMLIIATSSILSWILANWNIPATIATGILSMSTNKYIIMLLITIIILITGVFMETASALIILTPLFLTLITQMGISYIHFGLIMVMGLAIGMITPPVAINLYVASTITGLSIEKITKAIIPFMLGLLAVLLLLLYVPMLIPGLF